MVPFFFGQKKILPSATKGVEPLWKPHNLRLEHTMKYRYHYILFSVFIYSCCRIESDLDIIANCWSCTNTTFWTSFFNLIFFGTYISVYAVEYIKRISEK